MTAKRGHSKRIKEFFPELNEYNFKILVKMSKSSIWVIACDIEFQSDKTRWRRDAEWMMDVCIHYPMNDGHSLSSSEWINERRWPNVDGSSNKRPSPKTFVLCSSLTLTQDLIYKNQNDYSQHKRLLQM